jgi:hypothetical protein
MPQESRQRFHLFAVQYLTPGHEIPKIGKQLIFVFPGGIHDPLRTTGCSSSLISACGGCPAWRSPDSTGLKRIRNTWPDGVLKFDGRNMRWAPPAVESARASTALPFMRIPLDHNER